MMVRGNARYWWFALISTGIVLLDQASKTAVTESIAVNEAFDVIPGFLALAHARNPGAAFGLMGGLESSLRSVLLISFSVTAAAFLLWMLVRDRAHHWITLAALGLFFGGAVGNLIDRVRLGEVRDFIDVYVGAYHWPAFNLADPARCAGAGGFFGGGVFLGVWAGWGGGFWVWGGVS
jgi:signal peptidase II